MMWWMAAAAAAPYVISALQKKPKRPAAPDQVPMKNRDMEIDALLNEARNPNVQSMNLASDAAAEQVNRLLSRSGMGGSSVGAQLQANTQSQLAMKWLEEKAAKERAALAIALGYDQAQAGWNQQGVDAKYKYAMDAYTDTLKRQANQVQGISNMIGAGVGYYNQERTQDRLDSIAARDPYPQAVATYGAPGSGGFYNGSPEMPAEYAYGQAPMPYGRVGGGGY